jgi:hypothetical protein
VQTDHPHLRPVQEPAMQELQAMREQTDRLHPATVPVLEQAPGRPAVLEWSLRERPRPRLSGVETDRRTTRLREESRLAQ